MRYGDSFAPRSARPDNAFAASIDDRFIVTVGVLVRSNHRGVTISEGFERETIPHHRTGQLTKTIEGLIEPHYYRKGVPTSYRYPEPPLEIIGTPPRTITLGLHRLMITVSCVSAVNDAQRSG
jgi:hypothetical protein